ncbi:MAG: hypothetical protein RLN89_09785 [Parvibaculum sp.]
MSDILITSGLIQVTFGVLLGWPLTGLYSGMDSIGPLVNAKRVLQCHLDNIFMGILQMLIGTVFSAMPEIAGWLLLIGSWANPQLFLYQATTKGNGRELPGISVLAFTSFTIMTVAYLWLVIAWITR